MNYLWTGIGTNQNGKYKIKLLNQGLITKFNLEIYKLNAANEEFFIKDVYSPSEIPLSRGNIKLDNYNYTRLEQSLIKDINSKIKSAFVLSTYGLSTYGVSMPCDSNAINNAQNIAWYVDLKIEDKIDEKISKQYYDDPIPFIKRSLENFKE